MPLRGGRYGRFSGPIEYSGLDRGVTLTVVMPDGDLIGAHLVPDREDEIPAILVGVNVLRRTQPPREIYLIGPGTGGHSDAILPGSAFEAQRMLETVARALSYRGPAFTLGTPGRGEIVSAECNAGATTLKIDGLFVHRDLFDSTPDWMRRTRVDPGSES